MPLYIIYIILSIIIIKQVLGQGKTGSNKAVSACGAVPLGWTWR